MVVTKTSPTEASYQWIFRFYQPTDKNCAGDVIYKITKTGENIDEEGIYGDNEGVSRMGVNRLIYKDSKTIDDSVADLLEYKEAPLSKKTDPFFVGPAVSQKILSPERDPGEDSSKFIAKINRDKLTLVGDREVYPTTFIGANVFLNIYTKVE